MVNLNDITTNIGRTMQATRERAISSKTRRSQSKTSKREGTRNIIEKQIITKANFATVRIYLILI